MDDNNKPQDSDEEEVLLVRRVKFHNPPEQWACPHCHHPLNEMLSLKGVVPQPGDFAKCWYCSTILQLCPEPPFLIFTDPADHAPVKADDPFNVFIAQTMSGRN